MVVIKIKNFTQARNFTILSRSDFFPRVKDLGSSGSNFEVKGRFCHFGHFGVLAQSTQIAQDPIEFPKNRGYGWGNWQVPGDPMILGPKLTESGQEFWHLVKILSNFENFHEILMIFDNFWNFELGPRQVLDDPLDASAPLSQVFF